MVVIAQLNAFIKKLSSIDKKCKIGRQKKGERRIVVAKKDKKFILSFFSLL